MDRRAEAALLLGELDAGHSAAAQLGMRSGPGQPAARNQTLPRQHSVASVR